MTTLLSSLWSTIETTWEALEPYDRPEVTFHGVDGPDDLEGSSGDRCFWFTYDGTETIAGERGAAYTEIPHRFHASLRLSADGYNARDFEIRIARETTQLKRAIDTLAETAFDSGIVFCETRETSTPIKERDRAIVEINFAALIVES